jgi:hypothetical protein
MNPKSRVFARIVSLAPVLSLVVALASVAPIRAAQACDMKNCPHHAQKDAKPAPCSCPCGDKAAAAADAKPSHKCSDAHCKMAKCTDKKCCHFQGHEHHAS